MRTWSLYPRPGKNRTRGKSLGFVPGVRLKLFKARINMKQMNKMQEERGAVV